MSYSVFAFYMRLARKRDQLMHPAGLEPQRPKLNVMPTPACSMTGTFREELEEFGSLKAESVLLDPWSDPFGSVQTEDRPPMINEMNSDFVQEFLAELGSHAAASAEVQEELRQMKAELADVKARFAGTQAALEETQQQLLITDDRQYSLPVRARSPERADTVSPQRLRAMQETVQDLRAEIADLRSTVYQKDVEMDTLHRLQDQKGSELQAALWQVTSEAGKASRAQTDVITCREACKSLEEQLAEAHRKLQDIAGEQHLLENVVAKGRQENVSLRNSCSRLQDELTGVKSQLQDTINQAKGAERTASAREAEADALCKENSALKQQLFSMQQDCSRSRGAYHAVTAELTELRGSIRQMQKAHASALPPFYHAGPSMYASAGQQPKGQDFVHLDASSESAASYPALRMPKSQAWPVAPADQPAAGARNDAGLIRANRQTGRNSLSNSIQTPWGQPEPATRDLHSKAGSPRRQAQPVSSPDGPAAADRFASSQDALNRDAAMRRGSGYGASAAEDSPPNRSWDAESWHTHAAQHSQRSSSLAVPTDSSKNLDIRASSQQFKQQSGSPAQQRCSRHDYAGSGLPDHLQVREMSEHHSLDLDKSRTGQGSGQVAADLTDSQRSQHQDHHHRFCNQSMHDSRWPAEGSEERPARDSAKSAAKPYATDQSLQAMIRDSQGLESKLMKLNQEKAELEAEYARMPSHSGRNLKERKRKTDIECRFEVLDQDVNSIRLQLKKLGLK
ncbi:hypothetical protein WJX79_006900 [Trebouxia sp. C0005]